VLKHVNKLQGLALVGYIYTNIINSKHKKMRKTIVALLTLAAMTVLTSCDKDDDLFDSYPPVEAYELVPAETQLDSREQVVFIDVKLKNGYKTMFYETWKIGTPSFWNPDAPEGVDPWVYTLDENPYGGWAHTTKMMWAQVEAYRNGSFISLKVDANNTGQKRGMKIYVYNPDNQYHYCGEAIVWQLPASDSQENK